MKKLLMIAFICFALFQTLNAQPQPKVKPQDIYFFCSAVTETDEGIERGEDIEDDKNPIYAHRPILFRMISKQKNIYIGFDHYNYNPTELSKIRPVNPARDQLEIVTAPRSIMLYVNTFNPIMLEDKLASFKTKEEAWAWMDSIKASGEKIYLLDWNDPINKDSNSKQIRLHQVIPTISNRPLY